MSAKYLETRKRISPEVQFFKLSEQPFLNPIPLVEAKSFCVPHYWDPIPVFWIRYFLYGSGSGSDPKTKADPEPDPGRILTKIQSFERGWKLIVNVRIHVHFYAGFDDVFWSCNAGFCSPTPSVSSPPILPPLQNKNHHCTGKTHSLQKTTAIRISSPFGGKMARLMVVARKLALQWSGPFLYLRSVNNVLGEICQ